MANKHDIYYFDSFVNLVDYSVKAAEFLNEMVNNFDVSLLQKQKDDIHVIEHAADNLKREVTERLVKEFLPPFDREDILEIMRNIDDLTDSIEEVVLRMYMYNIKNILPHTTEFTKIILDCTIALKNLIVEFKNYKKSKSISTLYRRVSEIEEQCDKLYVEAVRELFLKEDKTLEITIWHELFDLFEHCCDACLEVSSSFETVYMKNI